MPGTNNILNLATDGKLTRTGTFTSAVGRIAAHYDFTNSLAGYASYARGRRPEVVNVTPQDNEVLPAEIVNSFELGLKGAFNKGRIVYDLAAFHYDYSNFQTDKPTRPVRCRRSCRPTPVTPPATAWKPRCMAASART